MERLTTEASMKPFILLSLLLLSGLSQAELTIENGHVRAMPPGQPNTAAFLHVTNHGKENVRLVDVSTPVSKKAEYHSHTKGENGMMRMAKEPHIDIPAGETFIFKTGGYHIMIMGLKKPLLPNQTVNITLKDSNGQEYPFSLPVVSIMNENTNKDHKHQDHSHH